MGEHCSAHPHACPSYARASVRVPAHAYTVFNVDVYAGRVKGQRDVKQKKLLKRKKVEEDSNGRKERVASFLLN